MTLPSSPATADEHPAAAASVANNKKKKSSIKRANFFPYGNHDFAEIVRLRQFFVDRTASIIPAFEKIGKHSLFLRPPRFGKSLLLRTLAVYYDLATEADVFRQLFEHLAICKQSNWVSDDTHAFTDRGVIFRASVFHPTPMCRRFHVLPIDLSIIDTSDLDLNKITARMHLVINDSISHFCTKYKLTGDVANRQLYISDSFPRLMALANALRSKYEAGQMSQPPRLLILVDEYDRMSNKLILENAEQYVASLKNGQSSFINPLRSLLETLKALGPLDVYKTLLVGLAPVAIADASGANVWRNISYDAAYSAWCGFTQQNLKDALAEIGFDDDEKQRAPLEIMSHFFHGYRFPGSTEAMYNPQMSLNFLIDLQNGKHSSEKLRSICDEIRRGKDVDPAKEFLVDSNSKPSNNVLALCSRLSTLSLFESLTDEIAPQKTYPLLDVVLSSSLVNSSDERVIISLLYHHGWLTIRQMGTNNDFAFRVTSRSTKDFFLDHLMPKLKMDVDIHELFDDPSIDGLRLLLDPVFDVLKDEPLRNEEVLYGVLRLYLRQAMRECVDQVAFETDFEKKSQGGHINLMLRSLISNKAIMIELKWIHPHSLFLPKFPLDPAPWKLEDYARLNDLIRDKVQNNYESYIRSISITNKYLHVYETADRKVSGVEQSALGQVRDYSDAKVLQKAKENITLDVVARFTAVLVGHWWLINKA